MKKLFLLVIVLMCGCSEDFSPNGEYVPKLIVYGVIDGNSSMQLIRVYSTYSPDLYDPLRPAPNTTIANATVRVNEGTSTYLFHDTDITVSGTSGNRSIHAYVNYSLLPVGSKNYSLKVSAPGYDTVKSSFKGLTDGDILTTASLFSKPGTEKVLPVRISMGLNSIAYLVTIAFEYRVGNESTLRRREVPSSVIRNADGDVTKKIYPSLVYRNTTMAAPYVYETVNFDVDAYLLTASDIKAEFGSSAVLIRTIVTMKQFDTNLYTYFSIANAFGSTATLRLDEPDYTNISNGFGVFGMMNSLERSYGTPSGTK
ncbi:MAG: DUF4249 family protein [Bacteroidota bacterium]